MLAFRSLALAGGADERMLDIITHPPSPNSAEAKRACDRRLLLWPRLCEAVLALKIGPARRARGAQPAATGTLPAHSPAVRPR